MVFLIVGDGLPDVPAIKYCGFALACGEFVLPAARAVGDAGPYMDNAKRSDKLKFETNAAAVVEGITHRFLPESVTNWLRALRGKLKFEPLFSLLILGARWFTI